MLNRTEIKVGGNSQTVQFNTPSTGILQKSHSKSRFIRFQRNSDMENNLFPTQSKDTAFIMKNNYADRWDKVKVEVTVLQILIFGADHYLCEIVENEFLKEE